MRKLLQTLVKSVHHETNEEGFCRHLWREFVCMMKRPSCIGQAMGSVCADNPNSCEWRLSSSCMLWRCNRVETSEEDLWGNMWRGSVCVMKRPSFIQQALKDACEEQCLLHASSQVSSRGVTWTFWLLWRHMMWACLHTNVQQWWRGVHHHTHNSCWQLWRRPFPLKIECLCREIQKKRF